MKILSLSGVLPQSMPPLLPLPHLPPRRLHLVTAESPVTNKKKRSRTEGGRRGRTVYYSFSSVSRRSRFELDYPLLRQ